MTTAEHYELLQRMPPHRVPRCPNCRLILPCRQDGAFGPCDARELTSESMNNLFALVRAVFEDGGKVSDKRLASERELYAKKVGRPVRAYGVKTPVEYTGPVGKPGVFCKRKHEQTVENLYAGVRNGKLRQWCRPCQLERYAEKDKTRRDQTVKNQANRTSRNDQNQAAIGGVGTPEPIHHTESCEPNRIYGGVERTGPGCQVQVVNSGG